MISGPKTFAAAAALALALVAMPAVAHPQAPLPVTTDRISDEPSLGVELGLVRIDPGDGPFAPDDFWAGRLEVSGHFVSPRGIGGYGSLAGAFTISDGEDESAVQDLELGGLYRLRTRSSDVWLRGGLLIDTADDDLGYFANAASLPARLTDAAKTLPATWFRLSATPIFRSGNVALRADIGLDLPLDEDAGFNADPLLRLNLGVGITTGQAAILIELVNVSDLDDSNEDDFVHTLAFSARFLGGQVEPYVTLGLPLDDALRDAAPFFLLVGISARL